MTLREIALKCAEICADMAKHQAGLADGEMERYRKARAWDMHMCASNIRAYADTLPNDGQWGLDVAGHEQAQARIAQCVRVIEILSDTFGYDPYEWLASPTVEAAQSASGWIRCSERMPNPYDTVLIAREDIPSWVGPITAFWTGEKWCKDVMDEPLTCTHWHSMPRLPLASRNDSGAIDGSSKHG